MSYLSEPERWRAVPGLEDCYDASTHGRIRRAETQRVRKPTPTGPYKRMMVFLSINGEVQNRYVGELVARTWIGKRPKGHFVCHGPAGQADCSPDNVYYGTPKRNTLDRKRDGTWMTGEQNGRAKLTWALVEEIRERNRHGESQVSLARAFRVGKSTIGGVVCNKTWVVTGRR